MKNALIAAGAIALGFAGSCSAAEMITAVFTQPDGGVTTGLYDGTVNVTVSGTGQSEGSRYNDAFYLTDTQMNDSDYYQLTFGTMTLVGLDPAQDAKNFLVGALPAYNPSNTYSFQLNTGAVTPTQLHFGVSDGQFNDNTGAYIITISEAGVPEPAAWALMLVGVGGLGTVLRRRRHGVIA